ncbi:MAG: hypothetical protein ACI39Q_06675 [Wujia sp.]
MSKKCCGMTYSDNETICKICGKPLTQGTDEEYERMKAETDKIVSDILKMQETNETDKQDPEPIEQEEGAQEEAALEDGQNVEVGEEPGDDPEDSEDRNTDRQGHSGKSNAGLKTAGIIAIIMSVLGLAVIAFCIFCMVIAPGYRKTGMADQDLIFPALATDADAASTRAVLTPTDAEVGEYFDGNETPTDATDTDADKAEQAEE